MDKRKLKSVAYLPNFCSMKKVSFIMYILKTSLTIIHSWSTMSTAICRYFHGTPLSQFLISSNEFFSMAHSIAFGIFHVVLASVLQYHYEKNEFQLF